MNNYCYNCKEKKTFQILNTYIYSKDTNSPFIEYSFTKCSFCNLPSLFTRENSKRVSEVDNYSRVFPKNEREIEFELPEAIKKFYITALILEEMKRWAEVVTFVGTILEMVCKDLLPESEFNSPFLGLKAMKKHGLISEEIMGWANELRILRNIGVHSYAEKILSEDAKESLEFLQAILRILYHLRPKFEKMKARRRSN